MGRMQFADYEKSYDAIGRAIEAQAHPLPWRVQAYRTNHVRQEYEIWNGHDKRADTFSILDAVGATVECSFKTRNDALKVALLFAPFGVPQNRSAA